jgi:hypothetical protein
VSGHPDDPRTIEHWTRQARMRNWRPTTLTVYGTPDQPRFAGVWEPNPKAIAWSTDGLAETFEDYQRRLDAQVTAWNRPAYVTLSPFGRYLSVFVDDRIGRWVAWHGGKDAYKRQRDKLVGMASSRSSCRPGAPEARFATRPSSASGPHR